MPADESRADLEGLRVVAHPLRLRLLSLLTGETLSAAEAARALGESQANVSYHLRRLALAGLVELVEEARVRGGTAKRYRHNSRSGESLVPGASGDHRALMGTMASELTRRAAGYLPQSPLVITDAEVWVPEGDWQRIQDLARELGAIIHDAAGPRGGEGRVRIGATLAMFQLAERDAGGQEPVPPGATP